MSSRVWARSGCTSECIPYACFGQSQTHAGIPLHSKDACNATARPQSASSHSSEVRSRASATGGSAAVGVTALRRSDPGHDGRRLAPLVAPEVASWRLRFRHCSWKDGRTSLLRVRDRFFSKPPDESQKRDALVCIPWGKNNNIFFFQNRKVKWPL